MGLAFVMDHGTGGECVAILRRAGGKIRLDRGLEMRGTGPSGSDDSQHKAGPASG